MAESTRRMRNEGWKKEGKKERKKLFLLSLALSILKPKAGFENQTIPDCA
jgi:hypothetical protein